MAPLPVYTFLIFPLLVSSRSLNKERNGSQGQETASAKSEKNGMKQKAQARMEERQLLPSAADGTISTNQI